MSNETHENGAGQMPKRSQKPVVVYILILFIAAFLLMGLSLLMHQRSNTEALGQLQNSVTAMKEVQAVQDRVIALQDQLADAEEEISALEDRLAQAEARNTASEESLEQTELERNALQQLYALQQQYSAQNYDACKEILDRMDADGLLKYLPQSDSAVTPPAFRYQQLKEAVLKKLYPAG